MMLSRRDVLKLVVGAVGATSAGFLGACRGGMPNVGEPRETPKSQPEAESVANRGRLLAKPTSPLSDVKVRSGLRPLGLGSGRDGLLYVPAGYDASEKVPLALTLHGAGGNARSGISHFLDLADEVGVVLLAPESRGRTWDVLVGGYGPDVEFIDLALDTRRLAITGFSDGASYALSLGLTNGDLFTRVIAFSPGFMTPAQRRGKPSLFVSHGTRDGVLPIGRCSRRIVPQLDREGYDVRYREFDGPHTVPYSVAREALDWFTSG